MTLEDQIQGCLLGGALGDAIGGRFEGMEPPIEFAIPPALSISDDTQLTLATCESIAERKVVDPESVASSFLRWFRARRITGIGASTLKALTELDAGGHWATVGASGERAAGNGAAMRAAPLAFLLDPDNDQDRRTIRDVCRITHRNDEAYAGALAIVHSLCWLLQTKEPSIALLRHLQHTLPDSNVRDRVAAIIDSKMTASTYCQTFGVSGYVADSVPFAILVAIETSSSSFMDAMRLVVESGDDTDTIGSMVGQLRGVCFSTSDLPQELDSIREIFEVRETVALFSRMVVALVARP